MPGTKQFSAYERLMLEAMAVLIEVSARPSAAVVGSDGQRLDDLVKALRKAAEMNISDSHGL